MPSTPNINFLSSFLFRLSLINRKLLSWHLPSILFLVTIDIFIKKSNFYIYLFNFLIYCCYYSKNYFIIYEFYYKCKNLIEIFAFNLNFFFTYSLSFILNKLFFIFLLYFENLFNRKYISIFKYIH